ncbi:GAF and ANTAR domain-containing protein [Mycobacterium sp. ITM-2016-00318]|uniref:GAF and ANTAR domain-containing protein n=1 Tax=Mycobacterium sp. ITM-2016-00318 TaxID=2099693 RepID=UPI000CF92D5F|nr:GAF and ANTAR domain-containing protein [Mycobacterium sp. ITM-2016-00318]WNG92863.1 GAF and ANTAR domain-containing protein [Mycobacterium sp. ITM-2016-00318]
MTTDRGPAEELAGAFARISGMLLSEATVATALSTVTSLASDTIAGSTGSGVSLLDSSGQRITSAATDRLVEQLDDLQYHLDEGPCLTAWRDLTVIRSSGSGDQRWPSWRPRAQEMGLRSFISAPLIHGEDALGAIKVYSTAVEAFDDRDEDLLRRFAAQAAIFVANVQTVRAAEHLSDRLKETLRARELIAMARGIVMERRKVGPDQAFRELAAESYRSRRLLHDVAASIVASPADG